MKTEEPTGGNGEIVAYVKPALMDRPAIRRLPAHVTVADAVEAFKCHPQGPDGMEVAAQLRREMAGSFSYLAVKSGGRPETVPATTRLADIAVSREIRTPRGLERVSAVAIYVQSYMPVGGSIVFAPPPSV